MTLAIQVHEVGQSFRTGFWMKPSVVLQKLSFSVPSRTVFGFLGANGAGKTTLIHLIVGLKRPLAGRIQVMGFESSSPQARACLGYLPERPYFHEHLTGDGLLKYFGALSGMTSRCLNDRIPVVLSAVGMERARHKELRKYSKGMLQRIGIAQAMLHDPELLILDEPMSGLDPVGRKEMRDLIHHLASEGRTIFFSSHVIPDVEAICDEVAIIDQGRLVGCGPVSGFLANDETPEFEIGFTGLTLDQVRAVSLLASYRQTSDVMKGVVVGQSSLQSVLAEFLKLKATVIWVNPIRPSLESLFFTGQKKEDEHER